MNAMDVINLANYVVTCVFSLLAGIMLAWLVAMLVALLTKDENGESK